MASAPLLNLRSLNPHVAGPLEAAAKATAGGGGLSSNRAWMMPRQAGGTPALDRGDETGAAVAGVSAFAYQVCSRCLGALVNR